MKESICASSKEAKILEIEGIRAVAISMVIAFHFFARWTSPIYLGNSYPQTYKLAKEISRFGFLGVQLFFIVSGFVILRTLERRSTLKSFAIARFKRIFPSLWIAIPLVFIICNALNQIFIAPIPLTSLIPSLSLLAPGFINQLFGTHLIWTTGVLWSLFIELQFYAIAGILFFKVKRLQFLTKLLITAVLLQAVKIFLIITNSSLMRAYDELLPVQQYLWWFLAGGAFYKAKSSKLTRSQLFVILISAAGNLATMNFEASKLHLVPIESSITLAFYLLFFVVIAGNGKDGFLTSHKMVWLGGISYELYLIHESLGVSVISKIYQSKIVPNNNFAHFILISIVIFTTVLLSILLRNLSHVLSDRFAQSLISRGQSKSKS